MGFLLQLFTFLGTSLELLWSKKNSSLWYFQFIFLGEEAAVIGCSCSPLVTSEFVFLLMEFVPGLMFPAC